MSVNVKDRHIFRPTMDNQYIRLYIAHALFVGVISNDLEGP